MLINKLEPFGESYLDVIRTAKEMQLAAIDAWRETHGQGPIILNDIPEWVKWQRQIDEATNKIFDNYAESIFYEDDPTPIYEDAQEVIEALEQVDFIRYTQEWKKNIERWSNEPGHSYRKKVLLQTPERYTKRAEENFESCVLFILDTIWPQTEVLDSYYLSVFGDKNYRPDDDKRLMEMVRRKAAEWYTETKPTPAYLPMTHGRPTDALAFMRRRNVKEDPISELATLQTRDGVTITYPTAETWGVGADQLFSTALAVFTGQNDFRHPQNMRREITIPLADYAVLIGKDVNNPDKKKAKSNLDNARKRVKKELETIQKQSITWTETVKGKPKNFVSINLVSAVGITNGQIHIALTPEIAEYFASRNTITMLPTSLLPLDPQRDKNAYQLGRKLAEHYSMDPNVERGTNTIISVQAALAATDLPSFEEVQATDRGHWAERIKEPLEAALDRITGAGQYLKDWKYTHAKGEELTDSEAANISTYQDFEKLYLVFTPQEELDNAARIARNKEKREKQTNKKSGQK